MADYQSSLTGQQMDSALTDLNNHTTLYGAEAWAKGTKGGVDVGSTDPTFHNNARYYAEVAQSAVPSENGAVLWNQSQNLSASEKAQARANIACGSSNRNLLDNGWFTINQRGVSGALTASAYWVDRWKTSSGSTSNFNNSILTLHGSIYQFVENSVGNELVGKTVTASALLANGTVVSGTSIVQSGETTLYNDSNITMKMYLSVNPKQILNVTSGNDAQIKAVKLELGSVSTLANDVAPDTATELAKCQAHCIVFNKRGQENVGVGLCMAVYSANAFCCLTVPFGSGTPSISVIGNWKLQNGATQVPITGIAIYRYESGLFQLNVGASNLTNGETYILSNGTDSSARIIIYDSIGG